MGRLHTSKYEANPTNTAPAATDLSIPHARKVLAHLSATDELRQDTVVAIPPADAAGHDCRMHADALCKRYDVRCERRVLRGMLVPLRLRDQGFFGPFIGFPFTRVIILRPQVEIVDEQSLTAVAEMASHVREFVQ